MLFIGDVRLQTSCKFALALPAFFAVAGVFLAQAPQGPISPRPGQPIQQPPAAQGGVTVRVALVSTPVTVRNPQGEMVLDLSAQDFRITDNGAEQKISHFDLGGDPLSLVILIETSSRIDPMVQELQKTGILFTETVAGSTGEAAVVGFNDAVDKLQDFTSNRDTTENTISRLQTGTSGVRLFDAMSVAVEMLSGRPQATPETPGRRRVLLIISEALDTGSHTKLGAVLREAQIANVTIYSVGLSTTRAELQTKRPDPPPQMTPPGINRLPPQPGTIQTPTTEAGRYGNIDLMTLAVWAVQHAESSIKDHALEIATAATGGAHFATYKDRSIEKAIDEIGGELHSQYAISYTPTNGDAVGYHEISVNLVQRKDKKLKIRARPGYYVSWPQS